MLKIGSTPLLGRKSQFCSHHWEVFINLTTANQLQHILYKKGLMCHSSAKSVSILTFEPLWYVLKGNSDVSTKINLTDSDRNLYLSTFCNSMLICSLSFVYLLSLLCTRRKLNNGGQLVQPPTHSFFSHLNVTFLFILPCVTQLCLCHSMWIRCCFEKHVQKSWSVRKYSKVSCKMTSN